jgi:hypothetical protein
MTRLPYPKRARLPDSVVDLYIFYEMLMPVCSRHGAMHIAPPKWVSADMAIKSYSRGNNAPAAGRDVWWRLVILLFVLGGCWYDMLLT